MRPEPEKEEKVAEPEPKVIAEPVEVRVPSQKVLTQSSVETKPKKVVIKANNDQLQDYIDIAPQETFMSNSRFNQQNDIVGDTTFLHWSQIGTVSLRHTKQYTSIDVEFSDKNFHRNICINDDFGSSMATMNYTGLALASKAETVDLDAYEEDDEEKSQTGIDKKRSSLYFKPFNETKVGGEWHLQLPKGESIECIASGTNWVVCFTDCNYLRFFSKDGIQKYILNQSSMVVTMAGYENLLAIVYHAGLPLYDQQNLKCKIIDTNSYKVVLDDICPISRRSTMTWFGFSDEGMLISVDDKGVVTALNMRNHQWIPILDLKTKFPRNYDSIWTVGFMDHEMMYIELQRDQIQPHEQLKSKYKVLQFQIPFILQENDELTMAKKEQDPAGLEEAHFRSQLILDHEQYRKDVWLPYKLFRGSADNERFLS